MYNVLKSIKLDHYILRSRYRSFLIIFIIGIFFAVTTKIPELAVSIAVVLSAPLICTYFSIWEKNNLNKLYGILPLQKSEAVIGRYLYALFIVVINGMVSGTLAYVISLFLNKRISQLEFSTYLSASFFYFCLMIAVLFPLYFRFAFSKMYVFSTLPFYLIFVISLYVSRKTDILKNLTQVIQYYTSHQYMILVTGFGLGIILLLISCPLACSVYKKTEL